jgi:hypothetical protein
VAVKGGVQDLGAITQAGEAAAVARMGKWMTMMKNTTGLKALAKGREGIEMSH